MKLIDKDALVAEIKRRLELVEERLKRNNSYSEEGNISWKRDKSLYDSYNQFLSFLDILEVKEVDLEEEIERVRKTHFINDDFEKATLEGRQITNIAEHFFGLGLKVQKGE